MYTQEVGWVLSGSSSGYDEQIVQLRHLDIDPTPHWMSIYLSHAEQVRVRVSIHLT